MAKTVIVIGPKTVIEVRDCINSIGQPAQELVVDGIPTSISDVGYSFLIKSAKEQGFAVFEEV